MRSFFSYIVRVHLYKIIIGVLILATLGCYLAYKESNDPKDEALLAGLVTGLIVAVIQYLLDWNSQSEIEAIKKLGIIKVLPFRDDKSYYQPLLAKAKREIVVMGNTAHRFFEDFAHPSRDGSQTLLEALSRNIKVQILLPRPDYLNSEDKVKAEKVRTRMVEIAKTNPSFEYRYFNHPPANSLVKIDDECLFGPIFAHKTSKDSPTIHASNNSALVTLYLQHIDDEWNKAGASQ